MCGSLFLCPLCWPPKTWGESPKMQGENRKQANRCEALGNLQLHTCATTLLESTGESVCVLEGLESLSWST